MIKLPRVIDSNGKEVKRLHPIAESINEKIIPLSYATLQVMKDEAVDERSYVELYTINGFSGIYRTRAPQKDVVGDTVTLQLEHAISEVGDWLIQDAYDEEITVRNAFVKVFSHYRGNKWQLGSFTATETVHLDVDYDNILETMIGIVQQQPKYYMTFNFGTNPWTVSLAQKSNTISAEGRLSRNISNVIVKRDDKDLCTRVYVKGLPKPAGRADDENAIGYMDADTQALYGIVEAQTGGTDLTLEQATRVAENYLALHKHPKISAEVEGYDFFYATGETIDKVEIAKKYRLTIPSKSVIVEDYITAINWRDVYNNPESVSLIVGDEQDPVMDFYKAQNSSSKSSRKSSKKQAKKNESFDQQFEITDQYGSILNQAGMHLDAYGMIVYARDNVNNIGSIIDQTASYIMTKVDDGDNDLHSEILQTQNMIHSAVWTANSQVYSYIDQTSTYILQEVGNVESSLGSSILQTASQIRSEVHASNSELYSYVDQTATYINQVVVNTASGLQSNINQQANRIGLVVEGTGSNAHIKPASIVAAINEQTGQSIAKISGDLVELDGDAIAQRLAGSSIQVQDLTVYEGADVIVGDDSQISLGGDVDILYGGKRANSEDVIVKAEVDPTTNTLKLWRLSDAGNTNPSITFSKAASVTSLTGSWSGGTLTVVTNPDSGHSFVNTPSLALNGNGSDSFSAEMSAVDSAGTTAVRSSIYGYLKTSGSTSSTVVNVCKNSDGTGVVGSISVGSLYTDGKTAGNNEVTINKGNWSGGQISFTKSKGTASTKTVQLTAASTTWNGTTASRVIWDGTAADAQHGVSTGYTVSIDASSKLTTMSINSNNTYTPPSGYIGFSSVTVNVPSSSHTVTNFVTDALVGESVSGYTNNSSGYYLNGTGDNAIAAIVITGSWKCDGVSRTGKDYLRAAPTAIYKKGYADGGGGSSGANITYFDTTAPSGATTPQSATYVNNSSGYYLSGSGNSATAAIVIRGLITANGTTYDTNTLGLNSYLQAAPTALYKKGYADGGGGGSTTHVPSLSLPSAATADPGSSFTEVSGTLNVNTNTTWLTQTAYCNNGNAKLYKYRISVSGGGGGGNAWLTEVGSEYNHQGYLAYDKLYGVTLDGNVVATWRTPSQGSHSVSLTVDIGWTGSISGYTEVGSYSASSLARTYIRVAASCGSSSVKRYWTIN